jgi:hypothetical protein
MKCTEVQSLLYMEPDGELPGAVQKHLGRCQPCQQVQRDLRAMRGALRDVAPPALPSGFELDLRRRLAQEVNASTATTPAPRSRHRLVAFAMAATVLLVLAGLLLWRARTAPSPDAPMPLPQAVAMQTVSYHRVSLAVHAAQAHAEALFDVELPGSAKLAGGLGSELGDGRVVRWRSDLLPGVNEIDLPIVLRQETPAPVQVRARLIASGKVYTTTLRLTPAASGQREAEQTLRLAWVLDPNAPCAGRLQ